MVQLSQQKINYENILKAESLKMLKNEVQEIEIKH